jgi:hypothetical protein
MFGTRTRMHRARGGLTALLGYGAAGHLTTDSYQSAPPAAQSNRLHARACQAEQVSVAAGGDDGGPRLVHRPVPRGAERHPQRLRELRVATRQLTAGTDTQLLTGGGERVGRGVEHVTHIYQTKLITLTVAPKHSLECLCSQSLTAPWPQEPTLTLSLKSDKIWRHPSFVDLLADPYQSRQQRQQQLQPSFHTLLQSVELVAAALQRTAEATGGKPLLVAHQVLQSSLAEHLAPFPSLRADGSPCDVAAMQVRARWVTLRARWVTLRAIWVTLRARWVTLRAR